MPDSFLYQPHVHGADGVLSPDVLIDRVFLVCPPDPTVHPLPLHLLTAATVCQQVGATAAAGAALVIASASRGALATVGSAHGDPAAGATPLAQRLCAKPVAREAVRLDDLKRDLAAWRLTTVRLQGRARHTVGATALSDIPRLGEIVADWERRNDRDGPAMLFVAAGHRDPTPQSADGYAVTLENERAGKRFELSYSVLRLAE